MSESLAKIDVRAMIKMGKLAVGIAKTVGGTPKQQAAVVNSVMRLIGGEYVANRETYNVDIPPSPPGNTQPRRRL